MHTREMLGKSRVLLFFSMVRSSGGSKKNLLKQRVRSDKGKLHAAVARNAFSSQNAQNTTGSDHFSKLGCNQNVQNTACSDHFLKIRISKNCTPMWCKAHFQIKMKKTPHGPFSEVQTSKNCTPMWREHIFQSK